MRHPSLEVESETQWKVTWFAPNGDVVRTGTEVQVRKAAELQAAWNPIIEKREIVVGPWVTEEVDDAEEV